MRSILTLVPTVMGTSGVPEISYSDQGQLEAQRTTTRRLLKGIETAEDISTLFGVLGGNIILVIFSP